MSIAAQDRTRLVELARQTVEAAVTHRPIPHPALLEGVLGQRRGCFVTLTNTGMLRGCIGTFHPDRALGEMVVEMAAAAVRDPRFTYNPITAEELPRLTVEVSVLSALELTHSPQNLELGTHGIYIIRGGQAGCFLPEVATEMGWSAQEFLDHCCESKAGLPAGAWKLPDTKVYLFTSEKFRR